MTFDSPAKKLLFFLAVGGLSGSIGLLFDILLLRGGMPRLGIFLLSNLITGAFAGTLFLHIKIRHLEKHRVMQDRLSKIADMNHHVRNALAVVAYYGIQGSNVTRAQLVSQAVERIEWALREVLPKGWNLSAQPSTSLIGEGLQSLSDGGSSHVVKSLHGQTSDVWTRRFTR
jgi:hypothetical protein